jgi:hypothetical protein
MTVEELAKKESVDIALLKKYNALPGGYVLEKNEWVLLPR